MKARLTAATIAIYFLFTIFVFTLYTNASQKENENFHSVLNNKMRVKILEEKWKTFYKLLLGQLQIERLANNLYPLASSSLFRNVNQFLTIQDIFILQNTCHVFQHLLQKNRENMVCFRNYAESHQMIHTTIIWKDLKYFLQESYSVFNDMEMFNIKENEYAVLTHSPEKKILIWKNNVTPYSQILCHQASKVSQPVNQENSFSSNDLEPSIFNKCRSAWAKITHEGNVTTGGTKNQGGEIPENIKTQLVKNVKMIVSTKCAFLALLFNGRVFSWGEPNDGGKIPDDIQSQLKNVKMIYSTDHAFAALLNDGHVFSWGETRVGNTSVTDIHFQLKDIKMVFSTSQAFAALFNDGYIFTWGESLYGGTIPRNINIQSSFKNIKTIVSTVNAFAALWNDGSVLTWGDELFGGQIPDDIQSELKKNVIMIFSTKYAFSALLNDGRAFIWGQSFQGDHFSAYIETELLKNVKMMFSNVFTFAALLNDGSVLSWGDEHLGGTILDNIKIQLQNVQMIIPTTYAFTALLNDGTKCTWPQK